MVIVGGLAAGASVASGETVEDQCNNLASRLTIGVNADGDIDLSGLGSVGVEDVTSAVADLINATGSLTLVE